MVSLTVSIPRSSDAFNSNTIYPYLVMYVYLANAIIVDVFPVPGGPYSNKFGSLFSDLNF